MNTLKAEKRDLAVKAKKLRREGYVTGNVFGKELEQSIPVKMLSSSVEIYQKPLHPYTVGLMNAIPVADPRKAAQKEEVSISGEIPSPINPPPGCRFSSRCKYCKAICKEVSPKLKEVAPGHTVACHLFD